MRASHVAGIGASVALCLVLLFAFHLAMVASRSALRDQLRQACFARGGTFVESTDWASCWPRGVEAVDIEVHPWW